MKSYTLDIEESKEFINSFNYDRERNLIILNYASGKVLPAKCTRENLIKVLDKMKRQIQSSDQFENSQKRKYKLALIMASLAGLMIFFTFFIPTPSLLLLITSILTLYISTSIIKESSKMLDDIKKNKLFLQYSDEIDEVVKNLTRDELSNIIKSTAIKNVTVEEDKVLYMEQENIPVFNVNSIDKLSLQETEDLVKTYKIMPKRK